MQTISSRWMVLAFVPLFVGLSACSPGGSGSGEGGSGILTGQSNPSAEKLAGVWISKSEGQELRQTGALKSMCAELLEDRDLTVMNVRWIEPSGQIYIYSPKHGLIEEAKFGFLGADGEIKLSPRFAGNLEGYKMFAEFKGEQLDFLLEREGRRFDSGTPYIRSSKEESIRYYAAQEDCRR